MTLKEAIEKAGRNGEIMRDGWRGTWKVMGGTLDKGNDRPMLLCNLTATDWEVVEDKPVIEVGDTVARHGSWGDEFVLIDRISAQACLRDSMGFKLAGMHELTLIRKGPKRIEGIVTVSHRGDVDLTQLVMKVDKRYKAVLEEMTEGSRGWQ